jgi:hypothetical protein
MIHFLEECDKRIQVVRVAVKKQRLRLRRKVKDGKSWTCSVHDKIKDQRSKIKESPYPLAFGNYPLPFSLVLAFFNPPIDN